MSADDGECSDCPPDFLLASTLEVLGGAPDGIARQRLQQTQDRVGEEVGGRYVLVEAIGQGSMGVVFRAQDTHLDRLVAIKFLSSDLLTRHPRAAELYREEIRTLSNLAHPNVVRILDASSIDAEEAYFVMEYLSGLSLEEFIRHNQPAQELRIELMIDVCSGVEHVHNAGYLHRDIKPLNVVVRPGTAKTRAEAVIADFGVAVDLAQEDSSTRTAFAGTFPFMSPEQFERPIGEMDRRSDVFGLGVTLHYAIQGTLPRPVFVKRDASSEPLGDSTEEKLGESEVSLVPDLEALVQKAIAPDRKDRYSDAVSLARDLSRFLAHEPISAFLEHTPGATRSNSERWSRAYYVLTKKSRRHPLVAALFMLSVVTITVLCGVATFVVLKDQYARRMERQFYANWSHVIEHLANGSVEEAELLAEVVMSDYPEGSERWVRAQHLRHIVSLVELNAEFRTTGPVAGNLAPIVGAASPAGVGTASRWRSRRETSLIHDEITNRVPDLGSLTNVFESGTVESRRERGIEKAGLLLDFGSGPMSSEGAEAAVWYAAILINLDQLDEARALLDLAGPVLGTGWHYRYLEVLLDARRLGSRATLSADQMWAADQRISALIREAELEPGLRDQVPGALYNQAAIRLRLEDDEGHLKLLETALLHSSTTQSMKAWLTEVRDEAR